MIRNIIFDLGDVFIDLERERAFAALATLGLKDFNFEMLQTNIDYELGKISSEEFLKFYQQQFPGYSKEEIKATWNLVLGDFPIKRFEFLKDLAEKNQYKLFLLSNTNEIHLDFIRQNFEFYKEMEQYFVQTYYSHKIGLRKPQSSIYKKLLDDHNLKASESLFIDDLAENIQTAEELHIHAWHLLPHQDLTELFEIQADLF